MSTDRPSTHRFERALHEVDDAIVAFELVGRDEDSRSQDDAEPIVTDANHAFRDLFSPDMKRVLGLPLNELIVPVDRQTEAERFDRRTAAGQHTVAFVDRTTTGGERTLCYCGVPTGPDRGLAVYTPVTGDREAALEAVVDRVADLAERPTTRVTAASADRVRRFAAGLRQSGRLGASVDADDQESAAK
ncbi:PAS domain-containing protein [Halohasta salina]|uniref:PAS domain-containing protein n=1 Tax=Halohasta salina TaxID=2961621 RepID=UPI0020A50782|nr:PAS domain-containing protein [Halohasta salina]